jgi:hypothetical protein
VFVTPVHGAVYHSPIVACTLIHCSTVYALKHTPSSQNIYRFRFLINNFDKIYIKNINIYGTLLASLERSLI